MTATLAVADTLAFFRAWLADPLQAGAVLPSGPALAELITADITPETAPVIELGPGTGVFTRALLERGVAEHDLVLVEAGPDFARRLARRFPAARLLAMDAARLHRLPPLKFSDGEGRLAGAVVSGLPMLSMSPRKMYAILGGAFRHLRQDGAFYQFTYGPRCPVPGAVLDRLDLRAQRIGGVFVNLPPASVYRLSRR
ncbi:class I SAM-dependent methyltransferase [Ferrovibrio xuzhouensis]|uniref:Class I SAM-dependent methyltransferase n=1 Tax=Ferrovibrio xuzhouensis TaxID=1576914 RepID=A0ABV7VE10_9PROT